MNVKMVGGGGAGGGAVAPPSIPEGDFFSVGGGGSAGASLDFVIDGPITGGPVTIGLGGDAMGLGNGTFSTVTINGILYVAAGGNRGGSNTQLATTAVATGAITVTGFAPDVITSGDNGMHGINAIGIGVGGHGGSGEFGRGGAGAISSVGDFSNPGSPGEGFGAGGGGAITKSGEPPQFGGDGAPGVVVICEYM